jgi:hypothetical protein
MSLVAARFGGRTQEAVLVWVTPLMATLIS